VGNVRYGLREGAGLWVFAVVASVEPLPAWREWLGTEQPTWSPMAAAAPGTVWWYDGEWMNPKTAPGLTGRTRGKGELAVGDAAHIVRPTQWLARGQKGLTAAAIGFGVGPAK
jgi:hypothetical protein